MNLIIILHIIVVIIFIFSEISIIFLHEELFCCQIKKFMCCFVKKGPHLCEKLTFFFFISFKVFVYTSQIYVRIKERLKTKGVSDLSSVELSGYFSPWYAEHIGDIQSASGNSTVQAWAAQNLRIQFYFFTYPSLLKLHGNMELLQTLNALLGNEAMLALDLKTIAPAFKDPAKRKWFLEVIDNYLKLWETNM